MSIFDSKNQIRRAWVSQLSEEFKAKIQSHPWLDQIEIFEAIDGDVRAAYIKDLREYAKDKEFTRHNDGKLALPKEECRDLNVVLNDIAKEVLVEWSDVLND